jgi:hypothetical protein
MNLADGAKRYRDHHGHIQQDELPPTSTAVQRGRARRRAEQGDARAIKVLADYDADQRAQLMMSEPTTAHEVVGVGWEPQAALGAPPLESANHVPSSAQMLGLGGT